MDLLAAGRRVPALAAALLVPLGLFYLFLGKRYVRLFMVGLMGAVGFELGRQIAAWAGLSPLWVAVPLAAGLAAVAYPLYAAAVFLGVGTALGLLLAETVAVLTGQRHYFLLFFGGGLLGGGLGALALLRPVSILLTAAGGAYLFFTGGVALGRWIPFLATLPADYPLLSAGILAVLTLTGVMTQLGLKDVEVLRAEKLERLAAEAKKREEEEARRRWERYLGTGQD